MKTFQFVYLNESSCIIRLRGLKSDNPRVTAKANIIGPDGSINYQTGKFEFEIANKTMLLQKVKAVAQDVATTSDTIGYKKTTSAERFGHTPCYCGLSDQYQCNSSSWKSPMALFSYVVLTNLLYFANSFRY